MANQYKNKVIYGNQTLMDITDTTATENDVLEGEVFYSASGARSIGTLGDATTTAHGLMSAADKIKLDEIDLLGVKLNTTVLTPDANGYVSIPLMTGATLSTAGIAGLVPAPATTDTNYFLRGDGTWASADTWGGTTYSPYSYIQDSEYYIPARASMNGTSMSSIWVSSTPNIHALAKYDANKYLYSTTPGTSDNSTKVATTAFVNNVLPSTMTGATSSAAGTAGLVPAPASADREKFFRGDGTWQDIPIAATNSAISTLSEQIGNLFGHVDFSLTDTTVTSSDQGGYYGEKIIPSLPTGAIPISVEPFGGYAGGVSYNIGYINNAWIIIISASKAFTFGNGRNVRVYYIKQQCATSQYV